MRLYYYTFPAFPPHFFAPEWKMRGRAKGTMIICFDRLNPWSESEAEGCTVDDWKEEVALNYTRIGYVAWVLEKSEAEGAEDE
jgi:hypothetical protein